MARYVLGRLVGLITVLIAVSVLIFLLIHMIPGGPFDNSPATKNERPVPEHIRKALLAKYGLDQPLHIQYIRYMSNALKGDFGVSFQYGEEVSQRIARTWPVSMQLGAIALLIGIPLGIGLGLLAALKPNSWLDYLTSVIVVSTFVTPTFVICIVLVVIFAVNLKWLPTGGWGEPKHMIMPVFVYVLGLIGGLARYTRSGMVEAMRADYIRTAYAKGLPRRVVILKHAFRNASMPLITMSGGLVVNMLMGTFFVENIFRIPGMGGAATYAIYYRDYPVIMTMILLWTLLITVAFLIVDLLYAVVDPRIRLGGKA
jgi:ABC-type dipeptide/oligopeptide/nickel transport system permease component